MKRLLAIFALAVAQLALIASPTMPWLKNARGPSGAAAPPAFSPSDISGLQVWLKADGNVYNTGTTQATDGQTVETWVDASGNSRSATQATSGLRPTFETNEVNGKPVIRFAGDEHWLGVAAGSNYAGKTVIAVVKKTTNSNYQGVFSARTTNETKASASAGALGITQGGADDIFIAMDGAVTGAYKDGADVYTVYQNGTGTAWSNNTWYVMHHEQSGNASGAYNWVVGADTGAGTSRCLNGDIAEVLVYDSILTTQNKADLASYFNSKYGLSVSY